MENKNRISENIKKKMQELNLSIYKLSKRSKVGYATVYDIVNSNTFDPRIDTLTKIAGALDEPIEKLIGGE